MHLLSIDILFILVLNLDLW